MDFDVHMDMDVDVVNVNAVVAHDRFGMSPNKYRAKKCNVVMVVVPEAAVCSLNNAKFVANLRAVAGRLVSWCRRLLH